METKSLAEIPKGCLNCLNHQDWSNLGQFVADHALHNGRPFGLPGYSQMLESDFRASPDFGFRAEPLAVTPPVIARRLAFDGTPVGKLFGLPVNGKRVRFAEHVFCGSENSRIAGVWSIIDQAGIAHQLVGPGTA